MNIQPFLQAPNFSLHDVPYVKRYDETGILLNPITRANPYFVEPKRKYRKVRNKPTRNQYVQIIPLFVDREGRNLLMREVMFQVVNSQIQVLFPEGAKFIGIRKVFHDRW